VAGRSGGITCKFKIGGQNKITAKFFISEISKVFLKKKIFLSFFNVFFCIFLNYFNVLILKIIFKK